MFRACVLAPAGSQSLSCVCHHSLCFPQACYSGKRKVIFPSDTGTLRMLITAHCLQKKSAGSLLMIFSLFALYCFIFVFRVESSGGKLFITVGFPNYILLCFHLGCCVFASIYMCVWVADGKLKQML